MEIGRIQVRRIPGEQPYLIGQLIPMVERFRVRPCRIAVESPGAAGKHRRRPFRFRLRAEKQLPISGDNARDLRMRGQMGEGLKPI
jgi:hypothetical protein